MNQLRQRIQAARNDIVGPEPVAPVEAAVTSANDSMLIPDPPPPCEGYAHHYTVEVETECGQGTREVDVCSDEPLCDAQLGAWKDAA